MKLGFSISAFQYEELNGNSDWYLWLTDEVNITSKRVIGELPEKNFYLSKFSQVHEIASKLNASYWRLNLSWGRLFKQKDKISEEAVSTYKKLLKDLKDKGFKVILCLNHFDLPKWVHDPIIARDSLLTEGPLGWYSEDTISYFLSFSSFVKDNFSEYVDLWCTFNEPNIMILFGYLSGIFPPGITSKRAYQKALRNVLSAHQEAYNLFRGEKVGIIFNFPYIQGNQKAKEELFTILKDISFDWIGVNYYTRIVVNEKGQPLDGYGMFCKPNSFSLDNNPCSDYGWEVYPEGLKYVLRDVKKFDKPIIVTENGIADSKDFLRPSFLISHIEAIKESKVSVEAYLYWSLIDNFEWNFGYQMKFGIYTLDLKARPSAYIFKELTSFV
ncbi:family 1 glycosylhydrolase [Sulfurisphaera ohwakuensis]|uniref:Beta-galactosidase n=1 Tax=Sulfurisphaera ohwakuensis TaxID=69656 RepID=A0A650CEY6_SULOH|nr:family 1 glycosylhydrolase [Sulfurisphaera ohwakuensis]MBB5254326.1 beta-galactosidase [Sulfurisphaera ohwakuensis]QGR16423.1 family 1 glycosylhydrolase [Sulfurisphaera ohwakuensis]